jgi:hypothetical protein
MGDVRRSLVISIIFLMFLSQFLLLCSGHGDDDDVTRKLGVFIRRRARRFSPRTSTSASATLLSGSSHMTACLASSFLLSLLF